MGREMVWQLGLGQQDHGEGRLGRKNWVSMNEEKRRNKKKNDGMVMSGKGALIWQTTLYKASQSWSPLPFMNSILIIFSLTFVILLDILDPFSYLVVFVWLKIYILCMWMLVYLWTIEREFPPIFETYTLHMQTSSTIHRTVRSKHGSRIVTRSLCVLKRALNTE